MTSGCKVGVLIPEPLGTLCGCLWRMFSLYPVRRGWVGYRGSPLHTGVLLTNVIFGSESHTNMFWNQNLGTTLLQEKHAAFVSIPFS